VIQFNIDKIKKGISKSDKAAFRELFNNFYPRLLNYAFVIIKNHEAAEDIVLEVLHSIWERRTKLKEIDRFENYLYVCTKTKTLDYHRKNSRLLKISFNDPHYKEYITHQDPEKQLIHKELFEVIDTAILNLPEKTRLVYYRVGSVGDNASIWLTEGDSSTLVSDVVRGTFVDPQYYYRPVPGGDTQVNPNLLPQLFGWD
jgi:RNA polymerase sigma factor (sigma-70 family)